LRNLVSEELEKIAASGSLESDDSFRRIRNRAQREATKIVNNHSFDECDDRGQSKINEFQVSRKSRGKSIEEIIEDDLSTPASPEAADALKVTWEAFDALPFYPPQNQLPPTERFSNGRRKDHGTDLFRTHRGRLPKDEDNQKTLPEFSKEELEIFLDDLDVPRAPGTIIEIIFSGFLTGV
jgi:hypothetical protein